MKYIVWIKENGQWEENGDGSMTLANAERVAREVRRECGVPTRVLPENAGEREETPLRDGLFRMDVERAVKTAIANLDCDTVGVSADCLWQLTRIRSNHGPSGTNAGWVARQVFNEIIAQPAFSKFVYQS